MDDQTFGVAVRGLTTVAMLRANFDAGMDYIDMFMPFILDAIESLEKPSFDQAEIQALVTSRHGLTIPHDTLQILLKRATKNGRVRREGGRYFREETERELIDLRAERRAAEREVRALAKALVEFASSVGENLRSDEDAMAWIFGFLSEHQVQLLLEDDPEQLELQTGFLDLPQTRLMARFVQRILASDPILTQYLDHVVEGFVLQNALLLRDVSSTSTTYAHLEVYFDSGFLFGLLGYNGDARRLANRELIGLLRDTNALARAFDKTISEMKRILGVYESHLATPDGRSSLWPTDITRYYLTRHSGPADVRQDIALLEKRITEAGVSIVQPPARVRAYTLDEAALSARLARSKETGNEPRIVHDVDCVAAVLTIRRDRQPISLDESRAIFVTSSGLVLRTVQDWYTAQGRSGTPPIIHQHRLGNLAWLKRPASGSQLRIHELVALCSAALRPSRRTWDRFLRHLRQLEASGVISTDEAVAVVVSSLTDTALADLEEIDQDPDAATLTEVVERVKETYRAESNERVRTANDERREAVDEKVALENHVNSWIEGISSLGGSVVFVTAIVLILVGEIFLLLPKLAESLPAGLRAASGALVLLVVAASVVSLIYGFHLLSLRQRAEARIRAALRRKLLRHD